MQTTSDDVSMRFYAKKNQWAGRLPEENMKVINPLEYTFYHGTLMKDWAKYIQFHPDAMVHVGSIFAARTRAYETARAQWLRDRSKFYIYSVALQGDANVYIYPVRDMEFGWKSTWDATYHEDADAFTYVNLWEDVGSASLYVRAKSLEVTKVRRERLNYDKRAFLISRTP